MTALLTNLIESLREELKQYGELLSLLESEREHVIRSLADELLANVSAINAQAEAVHVARRERAQRQRKVAESLGLPGDARMKALQPLLPASEGDLISALVNENNQLLERVKRLAHQNHLLLTRAIDLVEKFMQSFCAAGVPVYTRLGARRSPTSATRALYEDFC